MTFLNEYAMTMGLKIQEEEWIEMEGKIDNTNSSLSN